MLRKFGVRLVTKEPGVHGAQGWVVCMMTCRVTVRKDEVRRQSSAWGGKGLVMRGVSRTSSIGE